MKTRKIVCFTVLLMLLIYLLLLFLSRQYMLSKNDFLQSTKKETAARTDFCILCNDIGELNENLQKIFDDSTDTIIIKGYEFHKVYFSRKGDNVKIGYMADGLFHHITLQISSSKGEIEIIVIQNVGIVNMSWNGIPFHESMTIK